MTGFVFTGRKPRCKDWKEMHVLSHAQVSAFGELICEAVTCVCFSEQEHAFLPLPFVANPTREASHTRCLMVLKPPFLKIWFSYFKACHYFTLSFGGWVINRK